MTQRVFMLPFLLIAFVITTLALPVNVGKLAIGSSAPKTDVEVVDITGAHITLDDMKKDNGLLVMFSCNTCPWVLAWEDRYDDIAEACEAHEIGFILLNPNEAKRDGDDSMEEMKEHAKEQNYTFRYAVDKDHVLADAFGADRTPEVFLFDAELNLKYTGAIDNNAKEVDKVTKHYLLDAINSVARGERVNEPVTKSLGCSIKRID